LKTAQPKKKLNKETRAVLKMGGGGGGGGNQGNYFYCPKNWN